ncbi:MAG: DUF2339 domain-containing protein [bacterium]|nr:DUF2339 domain-containing protein [bacterium]
MGEPTLGDIQHSLERIQKQLDKHERLLEQRSAPGYNGDVATPLARKEHARPHNEHTGRSVEHEIGARGLGWVGFIAFIIGVSLFLKYAFDQGWINEHIRVLLGYAGGLAALGIGEWLRRKYAAYGNLIQGIGVAIIYLSTFAAFNFYGFINQWVAFVILVVITGCVAGWGLVTNAPALLWTSFVGAFLTPLLIHQKSIDPRVILFPYLLVLNVAIAVVARLKARYEMPLAAGIGTILLFSYWGGFFYEQELHWFFVVWVAVFAAFFSAMRFIVSPLKTEKNVLLWEYAPLVVLLFGALISIATLVVADEPRYVWGLVSFGYAFLGVLGASVSFFLTRKRSSLDSTFLSATAITILIGLWGVLPNDPIVQVAVYSVASLALFGAGVLWRRAEWRWLSIESLLFTALVPMMRVEFSMREFSVFATSAFWMRALVLAAGVGIVVAYHILRKNSRISQGEIRTFPAFLIVIHLCTIVLFTGEITRHFNSDYAFYSQQIDILRENQLGNQKNVVISLFWGLYAALNLLMGFFLRSRFARLGGLVLLAVTVVKVFIYDFWHFGIVYRMIASLSLGVILLLSAFLYHRFENRIKELLKN